MNNDKRIVKREKRTKLAGITFFFLICSLFFCMCTQDADDDPGIRLDGDATLALLEVDNGTLFPDFSADCFEYSVMVRNSIESITVSAEASSEKAVVSGYGVQSLEEGANTVTVTVKAESGTCVDYTIIVTRVDNRIREIRSQQDMAKIGIDLDYPLGAGYVLMENIELAEWLPIGNKGTPFTGVFDGNGKTITLTGFTPKHGTDYLGIFGYLQGISDTTKAGVKNLAIQAAVTITPQDLASQHIGLAVGYAERADIDNITLAGTWSLETGLQVNLGGVVGSIDKKTVIKNCTSTLMMDISPGGQGGNAVYNYIGGITGWINGESGIENCHNNGDVVADSVRTLATTNSGQIFAGGISGGTKQGFITAYQGYIQDSSFSGTVLVRNTGYWSYAGGIAATMVGGHATIQEQKSRIVRCFVSGTVSVDGTEANWPYIGGVIGYNYYGALVSQCYFNGTVINTGGMDYTGGIAGYNSRVSISSSCIEDCWSMGEVRGFKNAGGIVGQNQVFTHIRRCYSRAVIIATNNVGGGSDYAGDSAAWGAGGISGFNASAEQNSITACVALNSSISGGADSGRILGRQTTASIPSNNYAWNGIIVNAGPSYTPDIGHDKKDGADIPGEYLAGGLPTQAFYESLGWNFTSVWEMGAERYPLLRWQNGITH